MIIKKQSAHEPNKLIYLHFQSHNKLTSSSDVIICFYTLQWIPAPSGAIKNETDNTLSLKVRLMENAIKKAYLQFIDEHGALKQKRVL